MQQLFSQQLRFKDENGNSYPDWETISLGKIAEIKKGFTPSTTDSTNWDGGLS
jgi:type I restriction enzyme S subunit